MVWKIPFLSQLFSFCGVIRPTVHEVLSIRHYSVIQYNCHYNKCVQFLGAWQRPCSISSNMHKVLVHLHCIVMQLGQTYCATFNCTFPLLNNLHTKIQFIIHYISHQSNIAVWKNGTTSYVNPCHSKVAVLSGCSLLMDATLILSTHVRCHFFGFIF